MQTPRQIRAALERHDLSPSRSLGQHFLMDGNLVRKVREAGQVSDRDVVLEVGAGTGILTELLLESAGLVYAVELDERIIEIAREFLGEAPNLLLRRMNALERHGRLNREMVDELRAICAERDAPLKLVANLPYSLTSPLLTGLLENDDLPLVRIAVTVQYEVAVRITASPGGRDYGLLSVVCGLHGDWRIEHRLPGHVFWPRANVESAILVGDINRDRRRAIGDYASFRVLLAETFRARRKPLVNSLRVAGESACVRERARTLLEEMGLSATTRAEELSVDQLIGLWRGLEGDKSR